MRPARVHAGDEQSDAVGAFAVVLGVGLGAVADTGGDVGEEDGAVVGQARGEGLLFHEVGEDAGVGGETGEGDAVVGVDGDDFALVGGELFGIALDIVLGQLCFMIVWKGMDWRTFSAARTAWVLLTMPTTTEPCLTASCAYSTWKMRPWGELDIYKHSCTHFLLAGWVLLTR